MEDAGEVDLQNGLPVFEGGVLGGGAGDGSGVVDEDVDVAEVLMYSVEEGFGAGGGGEIGLEGGCVGTDSGGGFGGGAAVAVDCDLRSGLCECDGDGGAETAGCSCDKGDFAVEAKEFEDVSGGHEVNFTWRATANAKRERRRMWAGRARCGDEVTWRVGFLMLGKAA